MILYNSDYFGVLQLTHFGGSAVYRTILPSLWSTGVLFLYKYTLGHGETAQEIKEDQDEAIYTIHPFVITIYIMAFSLIITHRLNYCYQRYWEACSNIFMMSSKWIDSATTLAAFHYQSTVYEEDRPGCFGDEDNSLNQLKDRDQKKSAPTGGNTRTDMANNSAVGWMPSPGTNRDDLEKITVDSDSAASLLSFSGGPSSSAAHESTARSSMGSRRSFLSDSSRQRVRRHIEEENYGRAVRRVSRNSSSLENSIKNMFSWRRSGKRKYQSKSSFDDWNDVQGRQSQNSLIEGTSSLLKTDQTTSLNNASRTPQRSNLSEERNNPSNVAKGNPRRSLFEKSISQPVMKGRNRLGFSIRKQADREVFSERPAGKEDRKGKSQETKSHHRRVPSTDIPTAGIDGSVVKSFHPHYSSALQRRPQYPRNTGLHSVVFEAPPNFDFDKQLLEEKELDAWKQRQNGTQTKRGSILGAASRRRSSLPKQFFRSISNDSGGIPEENPQRVVSEPMFTSSQSNDSENLSSIASFMPRLELHDLPGLHERPSIQSNKKSQRYRQSAKKAKVESGSNGNMNARESSERPSSLFREPVGKMNGRASLFLQEAAHLYSLMSAVSMASLRADMEGVSSPLIDYVPGQKFPPVNPDEMQVKILVEKEDDNGYAGSNPESEKSENELRVRIKRNNKFLNFIMFLLGWSRNSRQRTIYNASRPFSVLGGISDAEVAMLRKVRGHSAQHALCCLWLREFITREHLHGSTGGVDPPIVARVYQHISDGTQQYNNCRRTAFTDFPFPHAQLTSFFGFVSIYIFPMLYYTYVDNTNIALILNFLTIGCFLGIQEVSLELEQPFIRYPNDLPLNNYQCQFNEALISSLYGGLHPDIWGDDAENEGQVGTWTDDEGAGESSSSDEDDNIQSSLPSDEIFSSEIKGKSSSYVDDIERKEPELNHGNMTVQFRVPEGSSL